jgi:hypothetical protein
MIRGSDKEAKRLLKTGFCGYLWASEKSGDARTGQRHNRADRTGGAPVPWKNSSLGFVGILIPVLVLHCTGNGPNKLALLFMRIGRSLMLRGVSPNAVESCNGDRRNRYTARCGSGTRRLIHRKRFVVQP